MSYFTHIQTVQCYNNKTRMKWSCSLKIRDFGLATEPTPSSYKYVHSCIVLLYYIKEKICLHVGMCACVSVCVFDFLSSMYLLLDVKKYFCLILNYHFINVKGCMTIYKVLYEFKAKLYWQIPKELAVTKTQTTCRPSQYLP